jgi:hypothetical protein
MQNDILLKRLQNFEILRGLDQEALSALAESAVWKVFAPDAVVFWEGDTETRVCMQTLETIEKWQQW